MSSTEQHYFIESPQDYRHLLKNKKKLLFLGMGGGLDIVSTFLVRSSIIENMDAVTLGGIHGDSLDKFENIERINRSIAWVNRSSLRKDKARFGEPYLSEALGEPILLLSQHNGVVGLAQDLNEFVIKEKIDLVVFVDGGIDALLIGDENELASPSTDQPTLAVAAQLNCTKFMAAVGFGVEPEVSHYYVLRNIANIIGNNGFLGASGLSALVAKSCLTIIDKVLEKSASSTILSIREALRGGFGSFNNPAPWTKGEVFVSPLMLVVFYFDIAAVYSQSRIAQSVAGTISRNEIDKIVANFESVRTKAPFIQLPL